MTLPRVAFLFPGQASQFVGMGKLMYDRSAKYKSIIESANEIMGFDLGAIMFAGPEDLLKETINTQPAVFLHSYLVYLDQQGDTSPVAVAGHSLGELTALVVAGALSFEDGLRLVKARAEAMQKACDQSQGTMAAILGLDDDKVEEACRQSQGVVIAANYNCPGQLVISGDQLGIRNAMKKCSDAGAKRVLEISVGGAFHSPLMEPAVEPFTQVVRGITFHDASIPIYQNVDAFPHQNAAILKDNLIKQITSPVRWTQTIQNMINDDLLDFVEVGGKGRILMGMVRKISREVQTTVWAEK